MPTEHVRRLALGLDPVDPYPSCSNGLHPYIRPGMMFIDTTLSQVLVGRQAEDISCMHMRLHQSKLARARAPALVPVLALQLPEILWCNLPII